VNRWIDHFNKFPEPETYADVPLSYERKTLVEDLIPNATLGDTGVSKGRTIDIRRKTGLEAHYVSECQ